MNREKYRYIFFRTDKDAINSLGGNDELPDFTINMKKPVKSFSNNFEEAHEGWSRFCCIKLKGAFSGNTAGCIDSVCQFSSGLTIPVNKLVPSSASYFISGEVMIRDSIAGGSNGTIVGLSMDSINPGENWWQGFHLNDTPQKFVKMWSKRSFSLMTPVIGNPHGILKIYLWNTGKQPLLIDDFQVQIFGHEK